VLSPTDPIVPMPNSSLPAADDLATLRQELAATARATAMLLIQPRHDPAELAALDTRAKELRAEIRRAEDAAQETEPVVLASRHIAFPPPPSVDGGTGRKAGAKQRRPRA
jgi:hypothetical protein